MTIAGASAKASLRADILKHVAPDDVARLSRGCRWRRWPQGSVILGREDDSDEVLFLQEGRAQVTIYSDNGRQVIYADLMPGQAFGELAAIDSLPRSADVIALEDCVIASMPGVRFRKLLATRPELALAVLRQFSALIRQLTDRQLELSTLPADLRLCAWLLRRVAADGADLPWVALDLPTHYDIACQIGSHREAVTKALRVLQRGGLVRREGGAFEVSPAGLQRRLHPSF